MIRTVSRKAALAVPLAALTLAMSSAYAANPGPSGPAFYNPPASVTGAHGDLISYRPASVKLNGASPAANAWNVMYVSQDADDTLQPTTGTVLVPTAPWSGGGARPVILYAMGTHGMGSDCAPSKQMALDKDYEAFNVAAALKAGYAVLISDYVGYTTGGTPRYMAGPSQGRNTLDIFKAAASIPGVGIDSSSKVAIWGYSQGGQAAAFAAELQPSYTPGMNVVGVAQGGTPGDLVATANYLNGRNGSAFLFMAINGLAEEYPTQIPFSLVVSPTGAAAFDKLKSECIFQALFEYQNQDITKYTNTGFTLDKMLSLPPVKKTMSDQMLGNTKINFPVYQFHGQADEFIPLDQAYALKQRYCAKGTTVAFDLYPSEHIATLFQAAPKVLSWLGDRFAGAQAPSTCGAASAPTSTANDNAGNLMVKMDKWPLYAKVDLKTMKESVTMPASSTFSTQADVNDKLLKDASISIPNFVAPLHLLGIGAQIGLRVEPTGPVTGVTSLDSEGILHIKGNAQVNITVASVWGVPFGLCKTSTPVDFPLNFDGPISALGSGNITFTGSTSFPMIKGCIISAIVSAFMTGSGQNYVFNVSPPAGVAN